VAVIFETERLIARDWDPERDAEDAFGMYGDPEVMRYLGRTPQVAESVDVVRERLAKVIQVYRERNNGTGGWALEEKSTGRAVGAILLKHLPDGNEVPTEDVEVGWHLRRSAWGQGYATEAARAAIAYGFAELNLPVIYSVVYKENERSIAVTRRLGMTALGPTDKYYGVTVELFQIRPTTEAGP
jgi:ribosomal-protein-alanine N-acetyltransferase